MSEDNKIGRVFSVDDWGREPLQHSTKNSMVRAEEVAGWSFPAVRKKRRFTSILAPWRLVHMKKIES